MASAGLPAAPLEGRPGLRDRLFAARNRLLAHPRFQRWASTFPPTRWIARDRAGALFDLCAGFVYSQILFACVELRLFERLADGPLPLATLATRAGLTPDAASRLLDAATALRLLERRGGRYGLGIHGAAYLGNPGLSAMIRHHAMVYRDLADPVALLKGDVADTELARFWPYAAAAAPQALAGAVVEPYSALMSTSQLMIADDVLDAHRLDGATCLLDVGGGGGDFLVAAARRRPDLRVILFDLPAVAERADARFARERLGARASAVGGDFKRDPLPLGADVVSLVRVAHDLADDALDALLRRILAALPPGGTFLLTEPMAETAGSERVGAYFAMYLLAMRQGRPRTVDDLAMRLRRAGFTGVRAVPTARPMLVSLLVARKSETVQRSSVRQS